VSPLAGPATIAVFAALALAPGAGADVLLDPLVDGLEGGGSPILVTPDGARRTLADPGGGESDRPQYGAVSPDRRLVARTTGRRMVLLPTDGGPRRVLGRTGLRPPAPARPVIDIPGIGGSGGSFGVFVGGTKPVVWWDADGSHVRRDRLRGPGGAAVIESCAVTTGRCSLRTAPDGMDRIAARADGGSLWTVTTPPEVAAITDYGELALGRWVRASPAAVRRVRAVLARRSRDALVLVGPGGGRRTLWSARRSAAGGTVGFDASESGPGGTVVAWERAAYSLQTRRRAGRPQARLRRRIVAEGQWIVSPAGRRTTFRTRAQEGERLVSVGGPAGAHGWYGLVRDRRDRYAIATVTPDGTVRRVPLAGRPLTDRALHRALGLGASGTVVFGTSTLGAVGYEAATDSLVVSYLVRRGSDDLRQVLARVPLGGAAPSLVQPLQGPSSEGPAAVVATAW
jgi:hypothetical protein